MKSLKGFFDDSNNSGFKRNKPPITQIIKNIHCKGTEKADVELVDKAKELFASLIDKDLESKIDTLNAIRLELHKYSPFENEPVDCVQWIKERGVRANDYNPNSVAPPEMELLAHSIRADGYTQPIVVYRNEDDKIFEIVDGFHRSRVAKECPDIKDRISGYLPIVPIKQRSEDRNNRIAATVRHNRARGKHSVDGMSDIVIELKRRNWSPNKIGKELGMDSDEVLRLCQISGLTELFSDNEFSKSWDIDLMTEDDIDFVLNEDSIEPDKEQKETRILHTYEKWECFKAGFYETHPPKGMKEEDCEQTYADFLSDVNGFEIILNKIINEWKNSCEHYLTNDSMNRIAWLGQAALCYKYKIPSCYRGGYNMLSRQQQMDADKMALKYLNKWLKRNGFGEVDEKIIVDKPNADIY